jgi:hypothetical protein
MVPAAFRFCVPHPVVQLPLSTKLVLRHGLPKLHALTVTHLLYILESNLLCSLSSDMTCKVTDPLTGYGPRVRADPRLSRVHASSKLHTPRSTLCPGCHPVVAPAQPSHHPYHHRRRHTLSVCGVQRQARARAPTWVVSMHTHPLPSPPLPPRGYTLPPALPLWL